MRSAAIAVVTVLMVLRTVAQPGSNYPTAFLLPTTSTAETTTETTLITCRPIPCDYSQCYLDYDSDGCGICVCNPTTRSAPITCKPISCDLSHCYYDHDSDGCYICVCNPTSCEDWTCGPGETCVMIYELQPTCVSIETTTTSPTPTSTTPCPTPVCAIMIGCLPVTGPDGCPSCECQQDSCYYDPSKCGPDETCIVNGDKPYPTCVSVYESTTETTSTERTTTSCPVIACDFSHCYMDYGPEGCPSCFCIETTTIACPTCDFYRCELEHDGSDRCGTCVCYTTCEGWGCDWEHETCVQGSLHDEPQCVSIYDSTTETTITTTKGCKMVTCYEFCDTITGPDGCPTCNCRPPCERLQCGPGEMCVQQGECPQCYYCVPETTTWTTMEMTTSCTVPLCRSECVYETGPDGCPRCDCGPTCQDIVCGENEECVQEWVEWVTESHFLPPKCVTKTTTLTSTTTPTLTPTPCIIYPCAPYCGYSTGIAGSDDCLSCGCQTMCENFPYCTADEECVMKPYHCFPVNCIYVPTCIPRTDTTSITPTTLTTTSPCRMPLCLRECNLIDGRDGCPICNCPNYDCQNVTCGPGQECVMQDVECPMDGPCYPQPTCVTSYETTTSCPQIRCAPPCVSDTGSDGCPRCACPPSCQTVKCSAGHECQLVNVTCFRYPCFPQAQCVPINETTTTATPSTTTCNPDLQILCREECQLSVNSDGCQSCYCPQTCEEVKCWEENVCEMQVLQCLIAPCPTRPVCVPRRTTPPCPIFDCAPGCYPVTRSDGCVTSCTCPPTCENFNCDPGYVCELQEIWCITDPCYPQPTCVAVQDSCTGAPNPKRCGRFRNRWTYNSVTDKCEKFRFYGCTPSFNTFRSPKACKNRCKRGAQPICLAVVCEDNCYTYKRKNQCPQCICPNPCRGFKCRTGYECKMRETKCAKEPQPFCTRISCPPQDPCGIRCMYGLKTDKNGCQLCECLEEPLPTTKAANLKNREL